MKLLIVTPYYWPAYLRGGPVISLHCLNRALASKGVDVTVYTTNVDLNNKVPVNKEADICGVKITYFAFTGLFDFIAGLGWQFSWQLTRALKQNIRSFDLIYIVTVWSYPAAIAAYYCKKYRKPYILTPRGMLYPDTFFKKVWKKRLYYRLILKQYIKGASAIHYTSEDEAEKTHPFLGLSNPKVVIPNGLELSEFRDLPDREKLKIRYPQLKDKKIILFLGRLNWKKGLDVLVKAYKMLTKDKADVHLLIVGGDEKGYGRKVKRWVNECGINYQVTFTGLLTGKDKLAAYTGSDIFVLPSYSENFAMAVAEAMACGLPVVISNKVGIYREIERNNAGIIINTRPEDLYRAMKSLLENPALRKELALNGRKLAEECYDINKVAGNMIAAYQEIINRQ